MNHCTGAIVGLVGQQNIVPGLFNRLNHDNKGSGTRYGLGVHGQSNQHGDKTLPMRLHRQDSKNGIPNHSLSGRNQLPPLNGLAGMGQTRRATSEMNATTFCLPQMSHGPNSDLNSPAKVAVVVQGQLQNQTSLRETLIERGYRFKGETDDELIAHLVDATYQNDPVQAVMRVMGLLEGSFAIGVLFQDHPERLMAANHAVPLYWALNKHRVIWSSSKEMLLVNRGHEIHQVSGDEVFDVHRHQFIHHPI